MLIVFASLFTIVLLSTYSLYFGAIIGDQWYHHGRSLAFMSGEFRNISIAGADEKIFSPFPNALFAAFFSISGIPSANAYASISFLNIIPVLAFYYFFENWVPRRLKKAALLACTLFMLSSGFGWVYVLDLAVSDPLESQVSALQKMYQAGIKSIDIILPTSFVGTAHPDYSTPLIILALPAGLTMLGIIKEEIMKDKSKLTYFAILLSITVLGIISHDEFYLFIIIASIVPLFLFFICSRSRHEKRNSIVVYGALLSALLLIVILAIYSFAGVGYFIYNTIIGIPLLVLCLLFTTAMCILYAIIRFFSRKISFYPKNFTNSHFRFRTLQSKKWTNYLSDHRNKTIATGLVVIIAWLYVFGFIVWGQLSVEDVEIQTLDYSIPWYLYPMKLGVTGLLGLAFALSYLFRRFEKEVFVFGIIIVVSLVAGPYYDEHRFSKYVMAGLAGFASLFVYNLLVKSPQIQRYNQFRILANSFVLGIVILSGALSILMFWGYNASAYDSDFEEALGRRDFPSASEFNLFRLLRNDSRDPLAFNVAAPANEYALHTGDLIGKVHAFSGIPWPKLAQSQLTLNASTLEGFYDLLHRSDTRYIVLPKDDLFNTINELGKDKEIQISDRVKQETNREGHPERDITIRKTQRSAAITSVLGFAIENFEKAYEDGKYLVLAVPPLASPQSKADIGLIIPKSSLFPSSSLSNNNSVTLQYNKHRFEEDEISKLTHSGKIEIVKTGSILHGDKGEITTFTSNPLVQNRFQNTNYIEATFRIIGENKTTNDAGIIWNDGSREYTASVRNDRLEMLVRPTEVSGSKDPHENKLVSVREINRENGIWYTLKIIIEEDRAIIYLNDMLAAEVPRFSNQSHFKSYQVANATGLNRTGLDPPGISRVGLFSFNNVVEFKPIEIGQVQLQWNKKDSIYFEYFYPMSILSLSQLNYETFMEGDFSVFSKKIIVLDMASLRHRHSSPPMNSTDVESSMNSENGNQYTDLEAIDYDNRTGNKYLEFAKKGGTLVITNIVNPDNNYVPNNQNIFQNTELAKLFSIRTGDQIKKFDRIGKNTSGDLSNQTKKIETPPQLYLNVSGVVQDIRIIKNATSSPSDLGVVSYYMHDDNKVAPFALEKKYGAGKIIVVNSGGYFSAIASSPRQYFQTLALIPSLINLNAIPKDNYYSAGDNTLTPNAIPFTQVVGDLKASGHLLINSTSLSVFANRTLESATFDNGKFHVQHMGFQSLSDRNENSDSSGVTDTTARDDKYTMSNAIIRDLRLSGEYQVIINLNGSLSLPSNLAYYDYIAASVPTGFNMIINLQDGATAEFIAEKGQDGLPVKLTGEGTISFYSVSNLEDKKNEIAVLLKRPEIKVINGTTHFEKLYVHDPHSMIATDGGQLEVKGGIVAKFDHVDNHNEIDSNGGWINTKYLSYLESVHFDKNNVYNNNDKKINIEFPADISALAKEEGVLVPWQKALLSRMNILTSLSLVLVAIVLIIFRRTRWLKLK